ncbi:MAG: hypothetical protein LC737_04450 [Chloroflexi bacterium]|nr:hypothetical protein [Chloroflexota bacterium]
MQSIKLSPFKRALFDDPTQAQQAAYMLHAQLKAQPPRLTDFARQVRGQADSNYKQWRHFLHQVDLKAVLWRL